MDSYFGRAFLSPLHLIALALLASTSLATQSFAPIACGAPVAEALFMLALPRLRLFKESVDRRRMRQARAEADALRQMQLMRISDDHRESVALLERLAASMRNRLLEETYDSCRVDKLVDAYIHLAVVHDEAQRVINHTRCEMDAMGDSDVPFVVSPASDASVDSRVDSKTRDKQRALSERRHQVRRANEQRLASLRAQLGVIEEAVKLLHERTILVVDPAATAQRVDDLLGEVEDNAPVVDALLELTAEMEHLRAREV
ncbi:MAG TPA: hypothetical protein VGO62_11950 [Myxococcota bacterium]|jgi:hypothetical protein